MQFDIVTTLETIPAAEWDALVEDDNPFARHAFLVALERHGAVGEAFGWWPRYLLARDGGRLVGAVPLYLKNNSYGELVFDWSWAEAYERVGLAYYPKLVAAIPYTPATGRRLLTDDETVARALVDAAVDYARDQRVSSLHWLFTDARDTALLGAHPEHDLRLGVQFHWHDAGYADFDAYLGALTASKRKKIRQERRRVRDQGIELLRLHGDEVSDEQWSLWHRFYTSTFDRKWGHATLSEGFFREIGRTMPRNVLLVLARHDGETVAGAFCLRGRHTLYGRHWGCTRRLDQLHFEACYYQGLEYCLEQGLTRFEPGAQGEHKIARGFLPARTWSAHWIADPQWREIIGRFLEQERGAMTDYIEELSDHSPFRQCR